MPNTFDAVPDLPMERSSAFLAVDRPQERLEDFITESKLQRGSLRWEDGYTVPFREGGSVRIRVVVDGQEGLRFDVKAPDTERREHIEQVLQGQLAGDLGDPDLALDWVPQPAPVG